MYEKTNSKSSGDYQTANLTIGLEVVFYKLKADRMKDFKLFYNEKIRAWLKRNRVAHANAWIVGDYLVVVSSLNMPPWDVPADKGGIDGLGQYLAHPEPIPMQELDKFTLSPRLGPELADPGPTATTAVGSYGESKTA